MRRDIIEIAIGPEDRCRNMCTCCLSDAWPGKGDSMSLEIRNDIIGLVREADEFNYDVITGITGAGEPIEYPGIMSLIAALHNEPNVKQIHFITFGATPDEVEYQQLKKLMHFFPDLKYYFSFHRYNRTAQEKMAATLKLAIEQNVKTAHVKMTVSANNFRDTYTDLTKVLIDCNFRDSTKDLLLGVDTRKLSKNEKKTKKALVQLFTTKNWSLKNFLFLEYFALKRPVFYTHETNNGEFTLSVKPQALEYIGRGANLKNEISYGTGQCYALSNFFDHLYINAKGDVFPDCGCSDFPEMKLGKVSEGLKSLCTKKYTFWANIHRFILEDKRMIGAKNICDLCKKITAERFNFNQILPRRIKTF
jgi:hypothetical protein